MNFLQQVLERLRGGRARERRARRYMDRWPPKKNYLRLQHWPTVRVGPMEDRNPEELHARLLEVLEEEAEKWGDCPVGGLELYIKLHAYRCFLGK